MLVLGGIIRYLPSVSSRITRTQRSTKGPRALLKTWSTLSMPSRKDLAMLPRPHNWEGLLRDHLGLHNPFIRPYFLGGCHHWGLPLDFAWYEKNTVSSLAGDSGWWSNPSWQSIFNWLRDWTFASPLVDMDKCPNLPYLIIILGW